MPTDPKVTFQTNYGDIVVELSPEKAPKTVSNFLKYVSEGHYTNTLFHRVIKGFMIQGGGYDPEMIEKKAVHRVENEANNGLKNDRYTVAMARTSDPHSAGAQFFINSSDKNSFLNFTAPTRDGWGYCVFGKVVQGFEVVDKIAATPTGPGDKPKENVVISAATVQ
jgi:peptidyl-prolyl cis-trans isomerase B (cyclophilin B)